MQQGRQVHSGGRTFFIFMFFRIIARCETGDGAIVCFWDDRWDESVLSQDYSRLASFALKTEALVKEIM